MEQIDRQAVYDQIEYFLELKVYHRPARADIITDYVVRLLEAERDRALDVARGCLCGEGGE